MGSLVTLGESKALVTTEWTWLRTGTSPVAARVDRPEPGLPLVGSLVVVPPILRERVSSFRALRYLSVVAARAGFASIVIDLPGDGDSPRAAGVDLESDWRSAVRAAEGLAGFLAPGAPMHQLGLRLGGCLLSESAPGGNEIRILWQPVAGRSFVRQQRNARRVGIHVEPVSDAVEFPGGCLSEADVASIGTLGFPQRPSAASGFRLRTELDSAVADRIALCPPPAARIPFDSIHQIVESLPKAAAIESPPWAPTASAEVAPGVLETIAPVGPHRLRSVLTTPVDRGEVRAAVAFTAMGSELSSGPGDLWASLARNLAREKVWSLRADRRGLGEAFFPDEPAEAPCYTDDAVRDTVELIATLRRYAPTVYTLAVGVCAGFWCFLRAAATSPLDHVIGVNPVHWSPDASIYDAEFYDRYHAEQRNPMPFPQRQDGRLATLRSAARSGLRGAGRLSVMWGETYRGDRIGRIINPVGKDTRIDVLLGVAERRRFLLKGGGWHLLRHRVRVTTVERLDHSLLSERGRRTVAQHVMAALADVPGGCPWSARDHLAPSDVVERPVTGLPSRRKVRVTAHHGGSP